MRTPKSRSRLAWASSTLQSQGDRLTSARSGATRISGLSDVACASMSTTSRHYRGTRPSCHGVVELVVASRGGIRVAREVGVDELSRFVNAELIEPVLRMQVGIEHEAQCVQAIATTCPTASCSAQNERSVSWSALETAPIRRSSSARHPRGRRHPGERELQPPAFNQHAYIDAWPPCNLHGLLPSAQFVSPARSPSQRCSATCWTSICCRSLALTSAGVLLQSLTVFFPLPYTLWCA